MCIPKIFVMREKTAPNNSNIISRCIWNMLILVYITCSLSCPVACNSFHLRHSSFCLQQCQFLVKTYRPVQTCYDIKTSKDIFELHKSKNVTKLCRFSFRNSNIIIQQYNLYTVAAVYVRSVASHLMM